jgi:type VI secretion system secreted protein VgrG
MERDHNNFLRILDAPGDVENYFLFRADGREMLSTPFEWRLTMRSQGEVPLTKEWIGAPITFSIGGSDIDARKINGQCVRFEHAYQKGRYVEFVIDVAPSLVGLRLRRDCRIFSEVTVQDVLRTILTEHGIDFDDRAIKHSREVHEYCVQYHESDFDFINRLMENEGIFYFFRFEEDAGRYSHKMYLADNETGYFTCDIYSLSFRRDHLLRGLQSIELSNSSVTGAWVTHDYNYKKPRDLSPHTTTSRLDWATKGTFVYEWPGGHTEMAFAKERSLLAMEETEAASILLEGAGSYLCFTPGARFEIEDHKLKPRERKIAIRSVIHSAWDPYGLEEGAPSYQQQFTAFPSYQPYRPPNITPPAVVRGPQTALVLDHKDPEGFGRVKVRFHWDIHRTETCWIRVAQQWGGSSIGAQFIPRPGMEVLVDFLEGDPDRPLVIGCLYNGDNKHPFEVPAHLSRSGWRTQTHVNGDVLQEFIFEDKEGAEEIYTYAGRNYRRKVIKDEEVEIDELRTTQVGKDDSLKVGGSRTVKIGLNSQTEIEGRLDAKIRFDAFVKIGKGLVVEVGQEFPPPIPDLKAPAEARKAPKTELPETPLLDMGEPDKPRESEHRVIEFGEDAWVTAVTAVTAAVKAAAAAVAADSQDESRAEAPPSDGDSAAGGSGSGGGGGGAASAGADDGAGSGGAGGGGAAARAVRPPTVREADSWEPDQGVEQQETSGERQEFVVDGMGGPQSQEGGEGGIDSASKAGALAGALGFPTGKTGVTMDFTKGMSMSSPWPLTIESFTHISLKVGPNSVDITPLGIAINGVIVRINS